jgi:hypothetical protein
MADFICSDASTISSSVFSSSAMSSIISLVLRPDQFINFHRQGLITSILSREDQEPKPKGYNCRGSVDKELMRIAPMEIWPKGCPDCHYQERT